MAVSKADPNGLVAAPVEICQCLFHFLAILVLLFFPARKVCSQQKVGRFSQDLAT